MNDHRTIRSPLCLIISSEGAQLSASKNGLTLAQLLQPFTQSLLNMTIPFRTPSRSYGLKDFKIQFVEASELQSVPPELAESFLHEVVMQNLPSKSVDDLIRDGPVTNQDLPRFIRSTKMPWWTNFCNSLERTFQHQQTEMFGHPVAILLVASTADDNPLASFEKLTSPNYLPDIFKSGQYDVAISKFMLLIDDPSTVQINNAQQVIAGMSSRFQAGQWFSLQLNNNVDPSTTSPETSKAAANRWKGTLAVKPFFAIRTPARVSNVGCCLTSEDLQNIEKFVVDFVRIAIIPTIEQRLFGLDNKITQNRKGFRNTISRYWRKTNTKESGTSTPPRVNTPPDGDVNFGGSSTHYHQALRVRYLFDTLESQVLAVADLAFMVQDYDYAYSMYRLARDDFGSDKSHLHQACALVMMARCLFVKGGNNKDVLQYLKRAISGLQDVLKTARSIADPREREMELKITARYLTQVSVVYMDVVMSSQENSPRLLITAVDTLAKASLEETSLCAALLLEQTGFLLLRLELLYKQNVDTELPVVSRIRKFGFHMVMASLLYNKSGHLEHALRCLAVVRQIYESGEWKYVQDHLDTSIADYCVALHHPDQAVEFWTKVLCRSHLPIELQSTMLEDVQNHLLALSTNSANSSEQHYYRFPVPIVDDNNITVHCQHNASVPPPLSDIPVVGSQMVSITEEREWESLTDYMESQRVFGEKRTGGGRGGRKTKKPEAGPCFVNDYIFVDVPVRNPCAVPLFVTQVKLQAFMLNEQGTRLDGEVFRADVLDRVVLPEATKMVVRLCIVPQVCGNLYITGLEWQFMGLGRVVKEFSILGAKLNDTKENRVAGARAIDKRLEKRVMEPSAWLGAEMKLPESIKAGEFFETGLDLINLGSKDCAGTLSICCNYPCMYAHPGALKETKLVDDAGRVLTVGIGAMERGLPIHVPMILRLPQSTSPNPTVLRFILHYKDTEGVSRTIRISAPVKVLPSVSIDIQVLTDDTKFLLCCSVHNKSPWEPLRVNKLLCASSRWELGDQRHGSDVTTLPPNASHKYIWELNRKAADHSDMSFTTCTWVQSSDCEALDNDMVTHFVGLENAQAILASRQQAAYEYERLKDRLEAEGKLPVSIQEIRRANKSLERKLSSEDELSRLERQSKAADGEPMPWDIESLSYANRGQKIHAVFFWEDLHQQQGIQTTLGVSVHREHPVSIVVDCPLHVVNCRRPMPAKITMINHSSRTIEGALLEFSNGTQYSWIGRTRFRMPTLPSGHMHTVNVMIKAHSHGMIELNSFVVRVGSKVFDIDAQRNVTMHCMMQQENKLFNVEDKNAIRPSINRALSCDTHTSIHTCGGDSVASPDVPSCIETPPLAEGVPSEPPSPPIAQEPLRESANPRLVTSASPPPSSEVTEGKRAAVDDHHRIHHHGSTPPSSTSGTNHKRRTPSVELLEAELDDLSSEEDNSEDNEAGNSFLEQLEQELEGSLDSP